MESIKKVKLLDYEFDPDKLEASVNAWIDRLEVTGDVLDVKFSTCCDNDKHCFSAMIIYEEDHD